MCPRSEHSGIEPSEPSDEAAEIAAIKNLSPLNALRFAKEHGYSISIADSHPPDHNPAYNIYKRYQPSPGLSEPDHHEAESKHYRNRHANLVRQIHLTKEDLDPKTKKIHDEIYSLEKIIAQKYQRLSTLVDHIKKSERYNNKNIEWPVYQAALRQLRYPRIEELSYLRKYIIDQFDPLFRDHNQNQALIKIIERSHQRYKEINDSLDTSITTLDRLIGTEKPSPFR